MADTAQFALRLFINVESCYCIETRDIIQHDVLRVSSHLGLRDDENEAK